MVDQGVEGKDADDLTFRKKAMLNAAKRLSKLTALGSAFLFIVAVWCGGLVTASSSFASASGCRPSGSATVNAGCEHSGFFCAPGSSFAFNTARIQDFSKNGPHPIIEIAPVDPSIGISLSSSRPNTGRPSCPTQKAPIHLFNSVLTI